MYLYHVALLCTGHLCIVLKQYSQPNGMFISDSFWGEKKSIVDEQKEEVNSQLDFQVVILHRPHPAE